MEEDVEVLFESWMLKLTGLDGRSTLRLSSHWKKRYFVLLRQHESASLLYYNNKPNSLEETPKGLIVLEPPYKVEKKRSVRGQRLVVSLTTPTKRIVVAVDDEKIFHLFSFFLQVQTKLRDDIEDECFVVRPDNSDDQRKIGARGNICLLHVSPWGITIAIQLSKCVLVQWPLSCIKNYESTGHGRFVVTVGKRASMGIGRYVFSTRLGQENAMYDRLDQYVSEAAGLRYSQSDTISQMGVMELENLHSLTYVKASGEFSNHLRKISRDIYDSLSQHFGTTRTKLGSPDLVSDSPHTQHRSMNSRSASMATLDGSPSLPGTPNQGHRRAVSQTATSIPFASPDFSSLPRNFMGSSPVKDIVRSRGRIPIESIDSQYLHPDSLYGEGDYIGMADYDNKTSEIKGNTMKYNELVLASKPPSGASLSGKSNTRFGNNSVSSSSEPSKSPGTRDPPTKVVLRSGQSRKQLQQSQSCDNLISYMEMSGSVNSANELSYTNNTYDKGDDKKSALAEAASVYSYASPTQIEETRAAAQKLAQRRIQTGIPSSNQFSSEDAVHGFIQKKLARQNSLKKAMSNPNIIDLEHDHSGRITPMRYDEMERPSLNFQIIAKHHEDGAKMNSGPHTASPPGGPHSVMSEMPKGIHTTTKTKVFRRPSTEVSPNKMMADLRLVHERNVETKPVHFSHSSNTSPPITGHSISGYGPEMKETHC